MNQRRRWLLAFGHGPLRPGLPHEKWGETPLAALILQPGATASAEQLRDWINERVAARYQRVDRVEIMADFPRNIAGKTLKC